MSLQEFTEVNNLKIEEARVEKTDSLTETTSWDLNNDTGADVAIIILGRFYPCLRCIKAINFILA